MKTYAAFLLFLAPSLCFADAQFSIIRSVDRGGEIGMQAITLVCGKEIPEFADCKVFRAVNGTAQRTRRVSPPVAKKLLARGSEKLAPFTAQGDTPEAHLRWTLIYGGKSSQGGMDLKDDLTRQKLGTELMALEKQLNGLLDP